jgi:hypothetical protein
MDGQKRALDENFNSPSGASGPCPGSLGTSSEDIRCRCAMREEIAGYEPKVRRARDEGIIPYQRYDEWAKAKGI